MLNGYLKEANLLTRKINNLLIKSNIKYFSFYLLCSFRLEEADANSRIDEFSSFDDVAINSDERHLTNNLHEDNKSYGASKNLLFHVLSSTNSYKKNPEVTKHN
jgi:hypothetical protein